MIDDIIVPRYFRWALGVPKMANSLRVISECGLTPFRHVAAAARAKYFLLLQSRPSDHLTTRALLQVTSPNIVNARPTTTTEPLSSAELVQATASCLRKWGLFFADGLPSDPEYVCFYIHHKKLLCGRVRQCSQTDWKNELLYVNII